MIRFLSVRHLAVVERLDLELQPGFTVLTGETGTGKTIVLGALNLLAGGRATGDLVRTGTAKAVVQAALDADEGDEIVFRREVTAQGRSRAFVNDALTTIGELQVIGQRFLDFHGQHAHQALLNPRNHLPLLDAHGKLAAPAAVVAEAFGAWRTAVGRLDRAQSDRERSTERMELLAYQQKEIDGIAPTPGEDEALAASRTRLANAERLISLCTEAYGSLYEQDGAALPTLGHVWRQVAELAAIDESFAAHLEARATMEAQLEDLAFALRSCAADVEGSPEQLEDVEGRLAALERLKRKHGPSLDDVLEHRRKIGVELDTLREGAGQVEDMARAEEDARAHFLDAAEGLSARRRNTAETLGRELAAVLERLSMPRARVHVQFGDGARPPERWTARGIDDVELYFSANPGEAPKPLARIASGGELSRVMLALKTLATTDLPGKTLVFDEIDAGIGGSAANSVGQLLRRLGERFQVVCVTHLPQIAAYADAHCRVSKTIRDGRTVTSVDPLGEPDRVAELARLMTGNTSPTALAGARALLDSRQRGNGDGDYRPAASNAGV